MQQLDLFQVLADPTRRQIVDAFRDGELSVNDVVSRLHIHQSGVSRHLRILSDHGFVRVRPEGTRRYYSLRAERFEELDTWLAPYRALWSDRLDRLGAALTRRRTTRSKS